MRTPEEAMRDLSQLSGQSMTAEPLQDVRFRLADVARQKIKRRHLLEVLQNPTPAWNPSDHPELEIEGGAQAWVKKLRAEAEQGFEKRTRAKKRR
jgi:hypothetical protein